MSSEMLMPFSLDVGGGIAITTDPNAQAKQHVDSLVSTTPGERAMNPTYGVDLSGQVFAPDPETVSEEVQLNISQAMQTWEPGVVVTNVTLDPATDLDIGSVVVDVDIVLTSQLPGGQVAPKTATILLGGTVVNS